MADKNTTSSKPRSTFKIPRLGLDDQLNDVRESVRKVALSTERVSSKTNSSRKNTSRLKSPNLTAVRDRTLENIDFSYSKKLRALSNSVKKQKALSKFDGMEEHLIKSGITMKKTSLELSELSRLISEFKQKQVKKPNGNSSRKKSTTSSKSNSTKNSPKKQSKKTEPEIIDANSDRNP